MKSKRIKSKRIKSKRIKSKRIKSKRIKSKRIKSKHMKSKLKSKRIKSKRMKSKRISKMRAPYNNDGCPSAKYDNYPNLEEKLTDKLSPFYNSDKWYNYKVRKLSMRFHPRSNPKCVDNAMKKMEILNNIIKKREKELEENLNLYNSKKNFKLNEGEFLREKQNLYQELNSINNSIANLKAKRKLLENTQENNQKIRKIRTERNKLNLFRNQLEKRIKYEYGDINREKSSGSSGSEEFEMVDPDKEREKGQSKKLKRIIPGLGVSSASESSSNDFDFVDKESSEEDKSLYGSVRNYFFKK